MVVPSSGAVDASRLGRPQVEHGPGHGQQVPGTPFQEDRPHWCAPPVEGSSQLFSVSGDSLGGRLKPGGQEAVRAQQDLRRYPGGFDGVVSGGSY